jgi:hypothetical protein
MCHVACEFGSGYNPPNKIHQAVYRRLDHGFGLGILHQDLFGNPYQRVIYLLRRFRSDSGILH